jgi:hypothetical protein
MEDSSLARVIADRNFIFLLYGFNIVRAFG